MPSFRREGGGGGDKMFEGCAMWPTPVKPKILDRRHALCKGWRGWACACAMKTLNHEALSPRKLAEIIKELLTFTTLESTGVWALDLMRKGAELYLKCMSLARSEIYISSLEAHNQMSIWKVLCSVWAFLLNIVLFVVVAMGLFLPVFAQSIKYCIIEGVLW